MTIPGNLLATAMAVMPHTDVATALEAAFKVVEQLSARFTLQVPFDLSSGRK